MTNLCCLCFVLLFDNVNQVYLKFNMASSKLRRLRPLFMVLWLRVNFVRSRGVISFSSGFRRVDERLSNPLFDEIKSNCRQNLVNYPKVSSLLFCVVSRVMASFHLRLAQPARAQFSVRSDQQERRPWVTWPRPANHPAPSCGTLFVLSIKSKLSCKDSPHWSIFVVRYRIVRYNE